MKRRVKLIAIHYSAFLVLYYFTAYVAFLRGTQTPWLATALDRHIPFVPAFVWFYMTAWVLNTVGLCLAVWHLRDDEFWKILIACYINLFLFSTIHLAFPLRALKPTVHAASLSGAAMVFVQWLTPVHNTFPSAHVSYSFITAWAAGMSYTKNRILSLVLIADALAVMASTVFTKQHTVLDIAGGIGVGIVSLLLARMFCRKDRQC